MLECDIEYPDNLHDLHNDYPLAPEKIVIHDAVKMSPYRESIIEKFNNEYNIKIQKSNVPKLVTSFLSKKCYVIPATLLKYYLELGLKIKIKKILTYKEKPWMKDFIEFNIKKRTLAKNDFEVDFFKLMNNSVYGKTMENVRKRCNFSIVNSEDKALVHISNPSFKNIIKINDNFLIINKIKNKVVLNKPFYVGVSVLDYSKLLMCINIIMVY